MSKPALALAEDEHPGAVSREEYLHTELYLLQEEIARMGEAGSWQALVNARRLALKIKTELDDLRAESTPDFDPMDDEAVIEAVLAMPDFVFADDRVRARVEECR